MFSQYMDMDIYIFSKYMDMYMYICLVNISIWIYVQSIYGYGFMDEQKKQMIQQWVEGQTMVHNTGN